LRLWGRAAGRCEYEGCNEQLWLDSLTKHEFNTAYIAHIVADKPGGPRGDPIRSEKLKAGISNLMLLCDRHHRLIDKEQVLEHPVSRLVAMKSVHEKRIDIVSGVADEKRSHVLLYGANIGEHNANVSYKDAARAMLPDRYPADFQPMSLGLINSSFEDVDGRFWETESSQLRSLFERQVRSRLRSGEISHLSVFAYAPQPLLILLGSLLSDIPAVDVYQFQKEPEPRHWHWHQQLEDGFEYLVQEPKERNAAPALILALSASIEEQRIVKVLGEHVSIWRVTVRNPHNDFLKTKRQAQMFRERMRMLMNQIKLAHGENAVLSIFPALPIALAVEFGRIWMPKADLRMRVYDENKKLGGFVATLEIGV
jgi:hypothetical protein